MLKSGVNCSVITLGSNGVFYKDQSGLRLRKYHKPLEPVSATGAGDSFTAAMVCCWLKGYSPEASLELAMKAAEITIMDERTVSFNIKSVFDRL
jgi:fructose-1-phosphate kinase PfkB-like protein